MGTVTQRFINLLAGSLWRVNGLSERKVLSGGVRREYFTERLHHVQDGDPNLFGEQDIYSLYEPVTGSLWRLVRPYLFLDYVLNQRTIADIALF